MKINTPRPNYVTDVEEMTSLRYDWNENGTCLSCENKKNVNKKPKTIESHSHESI